MLRTRFFKTKTGRMTQKLSKNPGRSFAWELRLECSQIEREATAQSLAKSLGRPGSPVFGVLLFGTKESVSRIAFLAHRAAVDISSWVVILREFEELLSHDSVPDVAAPSFFDWAHKTDKETHKESPQRHTERFVTISILDSSITLALLEGSCHKALCTTAGDLFYSVLHMALKHRFPMEIPICILGDALKIILATSAISTVTQINSRV